MNKGQFEMAEGYYNHAFTDDDFLSLLSAVPRDYRINIPRVYLLAKFWAEFYTIAKYGLEKMMTPPDKLFAERETKLAYDHASECHTAAYVIRHWALTNRASTE